jgi:hypothetical protein
MSMASSNTPSSPLEIITKKVKRIFALLDVGVTAQKLDIELVLFGTKTLLVVPPGESGQFELCDVSVPRVYTFRKFVHLQKKIRRIYDAMEKNESIQKGEPTLLC